MRDVNDDASTRLQRSEYQPPSVRALGTVAELTGSGLGGNADATNTADQPGGSGGF